MAWLSADDDFHALHAGLTVDMIATPRKDFACCGIGEILLDVVKRNVDKFDFMPVVKDQHDCQNEPILGIVSLSEYFHSAAPDEAVSERTRALHEQHLIGSDASILAFILNADRMPIRFLVAEEGIVGLVSLSDLQKLPVRAALFGLVTGLEIAMSDLIQQAHPDRKDWEQFMSRKRRDNLETQIQKGKEAEGIVDPLLYTQFCDKRDILKKSVFHKNPERKEFNRALERIESLRNDLAHANGYATDTHQAASVCATVRQLLEVYRKIVDFRSKT